MNPVIQSTEPKEFRFEAITCKCCDKQLIFSPEGDFNHQQHYCEECMQINIECTFCKSLFKRKELYNHECETDEAVEVDLPGYLKEEQKVIF